MNRITVRFYHPDDLPQVQALDALVQPYRPEDQEEVEAMFRRASTAQENGDNWVPIPRPRQVSSSSGPDYLALWVAVLSEKANERIVGMAGVGKLNFDLLPSGMPFASALRQRSDFLELQHVRVAPDLHGYGIGTQLCQTAIQWTQQRGYKMLLVNTTVPQTPALNLYLKLGFQEKARTFVSKYELIWLERNL